MWLVLPFQQSPDLEGTDLGDRLEPIYILSSHILCTHLSVMLPLNAKGHSSETELLSLCFSFVRVSIRDLPHSPLLLSPPIGGRVCGGGGQRSKTQ